MMSENGRPPRRVPGSVTHTWISQAWQYNRPDVPKTKNGIVHWTVPKDEAPVPIECLLFYGSDGRLVGILNYYPEGSPLGEKPHDTLTLVMPSMRRCGIGKALLREALKRWPQIDLLKQAYTDEGWALARTLIQEKE